MGWSRRATAIVLACAGLSGCDPLGGPRGTLAPGGRRSTTSESKLSRAQVTHEYPAPAPRPQAAAAFSASPVEAVRTFAVSYINWSADTVATQMSRLADLSVGQARSAMQLAAAQTANDYELERGGIANHGTVEAVAPLRGGDPRYAVVTREWTTATLSTAYQGLRPAWHVAVASVAQLAPGRWVVSGWQPES